MSRAAHKPIKGDSSTCTHEKKGEQKKPNRRNYTFGNPNGGIFENFDFTAAQSKVKRIYVHVYIIESINFRLTKIGTQVKNTQNTKCK